MRDDMMEVRDASRPVDVVDDDLENLERRYRSAKAILLSVDGESVLEEAAADFVSARSALRAVLEEIWPD